MLPLCITVIVSAVCHKGSKLIFEQLYNNVETGLMDSSELIEGPEPEHSFPFDL